MGVKAIHQSPVLDGRWFPLPSRLKEMQKNETHNILRLELFLPPTSFIILISSNEHTYPRRKTEEQGDTESRTDKLMKQKGLHSTAQDNCEIECIIDPCILKELDTLD